MKCFAAIDVGSFELAMKIFEITNKGGMKEIDHIRHRIELGTDTYNTGKISNERVEELCDYLIEFKKIMNSYKVDGYKIYGTSAIRETENTMIILEKIFLRTGLTVDVLSNSEQRFLHYKAIASKGEKFENFIAKSSAIVDIGGGSIQISLFNEGVLVTTQNIRLGILRMREMLADLQPKTNNYSKLVEELIDNHLIPFSRLYLNGNKIDNIIVVDDYISHIIQKGVGKDTMSSDEYKSFIKELQLNNVREICRKYGLAEESASLLPTSALLVKRLIKHLGAKKIWAPGVGLSDGMAYEYAEKEKLFKNSHDFEADIVSCAKTLAGRFYANEERNDLVEEMATLIFDSTKKLHGMGPSERLLLRVAAQLSDCGKYMSLEDGAECSYAIIMAAELIGFSHDEREVVANIVRFNKTHFIYYDELAKTNLLGKKEYLTLAKLAAIFRIADGACRSHKKKINDVSINIKDDKLVILVSSDDDIILEKGFFDRKARLFEEVFSVKPVLKHKKKAMGV